MSEVNVLDASAVLAYLNQEDGQEVVEAAFDARPSWLTSVNYCEVLGKLSEKGMPVEEAARAVEDLGLHVVDFDRKLARRAAVLRPRTRKIGASLGDRACLAMADHCVSDSVTPVVFTADRTWNRLRWPFKIIVIRGAA